MIGIYKITSPTGKIYIGSSIDIKKRIRYYKYLNCNGQIKLYNSIKKHGWEEHKLKIVCECDRDKLYELELYYGTLYKVLGDNGLNLILPKSGQSVIGVSESTRIKMSNSKFGDKNSFYGKTHTEETKAIISKCQTGRKHTMEHRGKVSINNAKNNAKLMIDLETGIFYNSIKEAAIAKGIIHSSLKNRVNGSSPTKTNITYA